MLKLPRCFQNSVSTCAQRESVSAELKRRTDQDNEHVTVHDQNHTQRIVNLENFFLLFLSINNVQKN